MAPMALASDGTVIANVAMSYGPDAPEKLLERARLEGRPIFVGIVLTPREEETAMKWMDNMAVEASGWIWGDRQRRRRPSKRIKRKTVS